MAPRGDDTHPDPGMSCGPERVWIIAAGEPSPTRARVQADLVDVVDERDIPRTVDNVLTLLSLVGSRVEEWYADDIAGISDLDWWSPSDERAEYSTVVARRAGQDDLLIQQVRHDDYTAVRVHTRPRPATVARRHDPHFLPEPGAIDRVGVVVHLHRQHRPAQRALVLQVVMRLSGTTRMLLAVEGYDLSEWAVYDGCPSVRHPGDEGRWPF